MNKIKLLPFATIATTALCVVPFVTSCKSDEKIKYQNVNIDTLINNEFERSTDVAKAKTFKTDDDVLEFYLQNSKDNHKIYTDDVYLSLQQLLSVMPEIPLLTINELSGKVDFGVANISPKDHRLSYGLKIDTTIDAIFGLYADSWNIKFNLKLNINAKDIKFSLDKTKLEDETLIWWAHPECIIDWKDPYEGFTRQQMDLWLLSQDKQWSFDFDGQVDILESELPETIKDFTIEGSYDHDSVKESGSVYLLETFYSILWHRVDYLQNAIIG